MKKAFVILAMGTALCLSAQDIRLGVQGAVSVPANNLADNANAGLQAGGHAQWDFRGGHGLMVRADLTFFGQNRIRRPGFAFRVRCVLSEAGRKDRCRSGRIALGRLRSSIEPLNRG